MELTSDVLLRGTAWNTAVDKLSSIFKTRPHYMLYVLCISIGIMYDKRIEKPEENNEKVITVPRNVIINNDNGKLDFMFQAAIMTTLTLELTEDDRLNLAFAEHVDYNKINLLTQFANYGVTKLVELIGETELESMENIKSFLASTVEGTNFEIDSLPDEYLLEGMDD